MGRGVSSGGGRSSLGYLFGSGEAPKPAENAAPAPVQKPASPPLVDASEQIPAGIQGCQANNYFRAEGQNSGNFITLVSKQADATTIGERTGGAMANKFRGMRRNVGVGKGSWSGCQEKGIISLSPSWQP